MLDLIKSAASETEQTRDREETAPPSSPPPEQRALLTAQTSTEEIRAIKTVLCDGVPPQVLNKQVLARHFSRFGNVVKVRYHSILIQVVTQNSHNPSIQKEATYESWSSSA